MSEVDPLTPAEPPHRWWHDEYGPMDPLAAQYLVVTWPSDNHDPRCPFGRSLTPYDCACVRRAQAIVAASLLRRWDEGRWANVPNRDGPKVAT